MQAARISAHAVDSDNSEALLDAHRGGVSANFLNSLADLAPPGEDGHLDIGVCWARNRPSPSPAAPVHIERWAFDHFRAAAHALKEKNPERGFQLEGYIVRLSRSRDAERGAIVVLAEVQPGQTRKVHIQLSPEQYQRALDGHRDQHPVEVFGTLQQTGRRLTLLDPTGLRVLPEDFEE